MHPNNFSGVASAASTAATERGRPTPSGTTVSGNRLIFCRARTGTSNRCPVATAENFKYSQAMKDFGAGKVWDEATLTTYLAAPSAMVKGTTMAFAGLKKPEDIADVIEYLEHPPAAK